LSYSVKLGYGGHIWDMTPELLSYIPDLLKVINLSGTFSLTSAIWSKTSFALTLLRLTRGWLKVVVWFIIISMNLFMGLSALFIWVQCTPIEKSWNPFIAGTCWPPAVLVHYNLFSAGMSPSRLLSPASKANALVLCSILCCYGHLARSSAVEAHLEATDGKAGESWGSLCHELRCLVRITYRCCCIRSC